MNEDMSRTQRILRGTIAAIVISVAITAIVLPSYVPLPKMSLKIPDHVELGNDLEFTLQVYGWQSNYYFECVQFYSDKSNSACDGKNGLFEKIDIAGDNDSYGARHFHATRFGGLPFPRTVSYKFTVPLRNMAASGKLGRGRFTGEVYAHWRYETPREDPDDRNRSRLHRTDHIFKDMPQSFPFSIQVQ